ncbi:hypothetical protein SPRG_16756 [Saprolegnia parasitica CBS 223.65]|uniref:Amino acid transporter n=1 Tax=Saprolegnia parasitica (strain CBS 223.65) TaxID=695850 RepID=A0A067BM69_SAPPC|nr:hypothetical protein SPRG_16756 [Saprolegnia parasitica CBS 223.65]KDO17830.1 hypothetical protein SPRG_16756 [Saprolegnia parasitica CBS 223.65]|eukprot:XP_012211463.1 hypothetical protein SPRG_16756 [Saprolegnia parasitica CBS 223.65]
MATRGVVLFEGEAPRESNAPTLSSSSATATDLNQNPTAGGVRRPPPPLETTFHVRGNLLSKQSDERFTPVISEYEGFVDDDAFETDDSTLRPPLKKPAIRPYVLSSLAIIVAAGIGVGLGLVLATLDLSSDAIAWVALPGDLFVRALRCVMVPAVFSAMAVAVAEIVVLKKASLLSWRTGCYFFLTSFLAVVQGMIVAGIYHTVVRNHKPPSGLLATTSLVFKFECPNGKYAIPTDANELACVASETSSPTTRFVASDVNHVLAVNTTLRSFSLTQEVISIINLLVPQNIFAALANGSLLSIITFALPLGFAIAKSHTGLPEHNAMLVVLRQTRNAMLIMLQVILKATPVAVAFLLMSAIVTYDNLTNTVVTNGGYLLAAFLSGVGVHLLLVMPLVLFLATRTKPFHYIQQLFPVYVFAFGCASSLAALPVAVTAMAQTRQVSRSFAQVVMCLGTPTNLNAAGLYHPVMTVFLATTIGMDLDTPQWVVLFFVSLLSSMGTAPVPNAGLVMLMTVWKTVFPDDAVPQAFVFLVAIDFILDRVQTAVNVNGNMIWD